jgi:hypothetical protein
MNKIDVNIHYVALAQQEGRDTVAPLLVDPILGALLCDEDIISETVRDINTHRIDANHAYSALAWNGTDLQPLLIDSRNGYVLCDAS